jgi:hypothetical protein
MHSRWKPLRRPPPHRDSDLGYCFRTNCPDVSKIAQTKSDIMGLQNLRQNLIYELSPAGGYLWFPHKGRVPHISLVFREMWDTTD